MFILLAYALAAQAQPLVVIDPGHVPSSPGAIASCGTREVDLNDELGRDLAARVAANGEKVIMTRPFGGEVNQLDLSRSPDLPVNGNAGREPVESLVRRPQIANKYGANVFVALHHDSAEDRYHVEDPHMCDGKPGHHLTEAFKAAQKIGYNVWVYQGDASNAARYAESMKLAKLIGKRMRAAGLIASDFHAQPVSDCSSCRAVDPETGVWSQNLAVLRVTTMPAVLVEAQAIDDPELEARAKSPEFRAIVSDAIAGGVEEYLSLQPAK